MSIQLLKDDDKLFSVSRNLDTIYENSHQSLKFNVMSDRPVEETLEIKKYIITDDRVVVEFDRKYKTEMISSPDHLIFLSALINLQKMIYVLMCKKLNIKYIPGEQEKLKIWPTETDVKMNGLIRKKENLKQDFKVISLEKIASNKYYLKGISTAESSISIKGSALIYKL